MPVINIPDCFPAADALLAEGIDVRAVSPAVTVARPLRIAILNLMPLKVDAETDLLRVLSYSSLPLAVDWLLPRTHTFRNTPREHLDAYYRFFDEVAGDGYDGMIITGAPLEMHAFEEVDYWHELTGIFDWARTHVTSTLYMCWGAFAGLYYYYGIAKRMLPRKCFGVFPHYLCKPGEPLFRGFDDEFFVPHSRHCEVSRAQVEAHPALTLLAYSPASGVHAVMARGGAELYVIGHSEYAPMTLDHEYRRDLSRNLPIEVPRHYYRDDDPGNAPLVRWRAHGNLLYANWLSYYVSPAPAHE